MLLRPDQYLEVGRYYRAVIITADKNPLSKDMATTGVWWFDVNSWEYSPTASWHLGYVRAEGADITPNRIKSWTNSMAVSIDDADVGVGMDIAFDVIKVWAEVAAGASVSATLADHEVLQENSVYTASCFWAKQTDVPSVKVISERLASVGLELFDMEQCLTLGIPFLSSEGGDVLVEVSKDDARSVTFFLRTDSFTPTTRDVQQALQCAGIFILKERVVYGPLEVIMVKLCGLKTALQNITLSAPRLLEKTVKKAGDVLQPKNLSWILYGALGLGILIVGGKLILGARRRKDDR